MPRRREIKKRPIPGDPRFGSTLITRFVNALMVGGKKSVAEAIIYGALERIRERNPGEDPLHVFQRAIDQAKPMLQVKSRRVGGATYQVPVEIPPETRTSIAFRWIIEFSRKRGEKTMQERLAGELIDCYNGTGATVKRREDTHRMAEANKAFAHFRY